MGSGRRGGLSVIVVIDSTRSSGRMKMLGPIICRVLPSSPTYTTRPPPSTAINHKQPSPDSAICMQAAPWHPAKRSRLPPPSNPFPLCPEPSNYSVIPITGRNTGSRHAPQMAHVPCHCMDEASSGGRVGTSPGRQTIMSPPPPPCSQHLHGNSKVSSTKPSKATMVLALGP